MSPVNGDGQPNTRSADEDGVALQRALRRKVRRAFSGLWQSLPGHRQEVGEGQGHGSAAPCD